METTQQPQKRPTGMTILLVLSFINACWNILRSIIMYFTTPMIAKMVENGEFEDAMEPFVATFGEEMRQSMMESMTLLSSIDPKYYLILLALFIGSLVGVIRMFKGDKRGFHIYAISQILMLINASVFVYPLQKPSPFTYDLLLTLMFIVVYYLFFKRMEMPNDLPQSPEQP
jgi:hypothetical protein